MVDSPQSLRSIGQALESLQVEDFELHIDGDTFLVRCSVPRPGEENAGEADQAGLLQHIWGVLPGDESLTLAMTLSGRFNSEDLDLLYTGKDVERLDEEGKRRRGQPAPQAFFPGISQCLRAVGAYVKDKPARLVSITRKADAVNIVFEAAAGETTTEVLSWVDLYDLSIAMFRKRGDRGSS
jgi:hypothetical protein